jgi:hypothetical protein
MTEGGYGGHGEYGGYSDGNFVTQRDLLNFTESKFGKYLQKEVGHVLRLFRTYERAMASTTIRASWLKTGFDYETRDAATYLIVNETKIRQGDAFREVWLFDYRSPRTSKKRASQRRGRINEHFFRKTEKRFLNK